MITFALSRVLSRHITLISTTELRARKPWAISHILSRPGVSQMSSSATATTDPVSRAARTPAQLRDDKKWNRLAERMKGFHDYFKAEFESLYEMADGSFNQRGLSTKMYLAEANSLKQHLTMHHTIEEAHIFPILAKRMPAFGNNKQHIKSHEGIHEGLDKLGALLKNWNEAPSTYSPKEMKECLDSWREVLFRHLDEEVEDLSGENMKKHWKLEELSMIPM